MKSKLNVFSKTENLSVIREFLRKFSLSAGFSKKEIQDIILAVDEACTNIIKHAYHSDPNGQINIELKFTNDLLSIKITDFGSSFRPEKIMNPDFPKYFEQKRIGGLGMYLMKTLMDDVKYTSVPGKYNQVYLSKQLLRSE